MLFNIAGDDDAKSIGSTSTSSSKLSTVQIQRIVDSLRNQCHRDSTKRNYSAVWKLFNQFFLRLYYYPRMWEQCLVLVIGYLIQTKKQSSTVKSYISAIKAVLKINQIELTEDQYLISSLTKACRLKNDCIRTRLPIGRDLLSLLLQKMKKFYLNNGQVFLAILYQTLFSTAYFSLFRVGELTSGEHPVLAKDVQIAFNKKKILFILRTSKTHWKNNKPQLIKISSTKRKNKKNSDASTLAAHNSDCRYLPCPYDLLHQYLKLRGPYRRPNEPFFIFADGTPVQPRQMRQCLKNTLKFAGCDESLYGVHSLRSGRAGDLLDLGLSVETIKKIGRWKSNAVFRYLK